MNHIRRITALAAVCLFLCSSVAAFAATPERKTYANPPVTVSLPESVYDGTAFACDLSGPGLRSVTVSFLGKSVTARAEPGAGPSGDRETRAIVLLPVPLDHAKGIQHVSWSATLADGSTVGGASPVTIKKRRYPVQKLSVPPKYVTPDPSLKERIAHERERMAQAFAVRSDVRRWPAPGEPPMLRPVAGKITSLYGLRREFNGQRRNPHKGVDFRGAAGTPIKVVADGTVVLTGDFYYSGQFVVVDHGLGVLTISMHMSKILADVGQKVTAGDIIGLVGSTGRSTGPHLHLSLLVLGESVDALPLLAMTAEDRAAYERPAAGSAKNPGRKAAKKKASPTPKNASVQNPKK